MLRWWRWRRLWLHLLLWLRLWLLLLLWLRIAWLYSSSGAPVSGSRRRTIRRTPNIVGVGIRLSVMRAMIDIRFGIAVWTISPGLLWGPVRTSRLNGFPRLPLPRIRLGLLRTEEVFNGADFI